jgi:hypothetical protein
MKHAEGEREFMVGDGNENASGVLNENVAGSGDGLNNAVVVVVVGLSDDGNRFHDCWLLLLTMTNLCV